MNISFHGGVDAVTGSCYLMDFGRYKVLVDCGMHQGEQMCSSKNFEDFGFDVTQVDAVIVTHAHYDHCGRLPLLVKRGFTGKIFCTPPTKALMELVLRDGFYVMQEEVRKCGGELLYEPEHIDQTLSLVKTMNYHTEFFPLPGASFTFFDAGHILGSAFVKVHYEDVSLVFSGDVGNDHAPILPSTESLPNVQYLITESTYGDRDHDMPESRNRYLGEAIRTILSRGGTAVIPAFALERSQELLYALDRLMDAGEIPRTTVYFDSPLAIRATEVYREFAQYLHFDESILRSRDRDFFSFPGLKVCLSVDDSKLINEDTGAKIIIAGSGMMTGGRVLHHLKRYLPDENSGVIIIGYQADRTLGRQIQDGAREVRIHNVPVAVRARIFEVESFSAHGDRAKLINWIEGISDSIKTVFLVHGDSATKESFKTQLEQENIVQHVVIPVHESMFEL